MKVSVWLPSKYCFVFIFQWHHRRTDRDRCNNPQRPLSIPLQKLRKQSQTVKMLPLPLWGWLQSCAINTILGKGHSGKWRSNSIGITRKHSCQKQNMNSKFGILLAYDWQHQLRLPSIPLNSWCFLFILVLVSYQTQWTFRFGLKQIHGWA